MRIFAYKSVISGAILLSFPVMVSCSVFSGGNEFSNNPAVAAQQREVQALKRELKEAERYAEEAKQREKAAENRLKAAEHELKALKERARRENDY